MRQGYARNAFVVIGRAGIDLYANPVGTRIEDAKDYVACLGGSSANTAVCLARQGSKVSLVTSVSNDAVGRFTLRELEGYGVNTRLAQMIGGEVRTSLAVVETRNDEPQTVLYRNQAADFELVGELDFDHIAHEFGALVVTGTALAAEPSRTFCRNAMAEASRRDMGVVLDIDHRSYSWPSPEEAARVYLDAASQCDVVVGNDTEFSVMARDREKAVDLARELASTSSRIVVFKMGQDGAITFHEGSAFRTGVFRVEPLKPTGAGDAFLGGMLSSMGRGFGLKQSVLRGSACAAIVVTRVGCAPAMPDRSELDAFMADHQDEILISDGI